MTGGYHKDRRKFSIFLSSFQAENQKEQDPYQPYQFEELLHRPSYQMFYPTMPMPRMQGEFMQNIFSPGRLNVYQQASTMSAATQPASTSQQGASTSQQGASTSQQGASSSQKAAIQPQPEPSNQQGRKRRQEWSQAEEIALCKAWPKKYAKLKKASTKVKGQIWLEIFGEFIASVETQKDLEQMKTKTRSLESNFKEIKLRMSRTGEEGANKIKEKIDHIYELMDQYLSERDSVDPEKMKIMSSGLETDLVEPFANDLGREILLDVTNPTIIS